MNFAKAGKGLATLVNGANRRSILARVFERKGGSMRIMQIVLLGAAVTAVSAQAAEPVSRQVQSVPIEYVSPGASGSIGSSSSSQSYDVYGGYAIPSDSGSTQRHAYGSSDVQQNGGIRQSIKYPGGLEVQRYPGQSSYEEQRQQ